MPGEHVITNEHVLSYQCSAPIEDETMGKSKMIENSSEKFFQEYQGGAGMWGSFNRASEKSVRV